MMLIVVIAFFLVTEIPLMTITLLHTLSSRYQVNTYIQNPTNLFLCSFGLIVLDYDIAKDIVIIINVLICVSFPVNFAIYCGMSREENCIHKLSLYKFFNTGSSGTHSLPSSFLLLHPQTPHS